MPDPALAHARRGAEWTFDARAYHACLAQIKATGAAGWGWRLRPCLHPGRLPTLWLVWFGPTTAPCPAPKPHSPGPSAGPSPVRAGEGEAPSFDHGVGDPVAADIRVERHHRVVLSEGNWLLLVGGAEPRGQAQARGGGGRAPGATPGHPAPVCSPLPLLASACVCVLGPLCCCCRAQSPGGSCRSCLTRQAAIAPCQHGRSSCTSMHAREGLHARLAPLLTA